MNFFIPSLGPNFLGFHMEQKLINVTMKLPFFPLFGNLKNFKNESNHYFQINWGGNMRKKFTIISIMLLILVPLLATTVNAEPDPEEYAPILYFEGEETCYPIDAEYHLDYSSLGSVGLLGLTVQYYDNNQGSIDDNGVIEHYKSVRNNYETKVYYRIYNYQLSDVIQYWMFYAFNKGELNQHEGDWEMVQIVFENDEPKDVGYSQHYSGQSATWNQVEKEGNHMKVYVSRGSHANYLRSYSGKVGIASDIVGANGVVLDSRKNDYTLEDIEAATNTWIDFEGRWGEVPDNVDDAIQASFLGQAGPEGPKYRTTMSGVSLWDDPAVWGNSLLPAQDLLFPVEWLVYNFVMIYLLITIAVVALMAFRIYRRHKKYGLGPRIVSMFYINNPNLHSIGNILCIVGIVVAFIGLFSPWYAASYGVSGSGITSFETEGMVDLLSLHGINGLQITLPGTSGPMPMGSFDMPISLFIAIGLILMIIATIGIPFSNKLGKKYFFRGIRLLIPFILIIVLVIAIGSIVPSVAGGGVISDYVREIISPITSSPLGGQTATAITVPGVSAQVSLQWGLSIGAWMLLIAAIIMFISGILEIMAKTQFFATKVPLPGGAPPKIHAQQPPIPPQQPPAQQPPPPSKPPAPKKQAPPKSKPKAMFCPECGTKLEDKATFCVKCGYKLGK